MKTVIEYQRRESSSSCYWKWLISCGIFGILIGLTNLYETVHGARGYFYVVLSRWGYSHDAAAALSATGCAVTVGGAAAAMLHASCFFWRSRRGVQDDSTTPVVRAVYLWTLLGSLWCGLCWVPGIVLDEQCFMILSYVNRPLSGINVNASSSGKEWLLICTISNGIIYGGVGTFLYFFARLFRTSHRGESS